MTPKTRERLKNAAIALYILQRLFELFLTTFGGYQIGTMLHERFPLTVSRGVVAGVLLVLVFIPVKMIAQKALRERFMEDAP